MAENSKIAWTDNTFNPWIGCSRVSPGCQNCYAENLMDRRYHRVEWGPGKPRTRTKTWHEPVKWNRQAEKDGIRKKVFCASLSDWLDDEVPAQWREDLCDLIEATPNLDWLMLTKRPENYTTMVPPIWLEEPLKNVWVGFTAENQEWFDKRYPIVAEIPAWLKWCSYEPALGPIDLPVICHLNWMIIGGESNQMDPARPFDLEWATRMIQQCHRRRIIPFVKQLGSNVIELGEPGKYSFASKDGSDPTEWPLGLRIRDFPTVGA